MVIPLDEAKRQRGFCFITFDTAEAATACIDGANQLNFQGRPLTVVRAAEKASAASSSSGSEKPKSYKHLQEVERRRRAQESKGWNASHIRTDAVVDSMAERLGVNKADVLGDDKNMAVRLALGQTALVAENQSYFEHEGLDLSALETTHGAKPFERSDTTILVKNIPTSSNSSELTQLFSKFGQLIRLLLPPSRTVALVEFVDPINARRAFKGLAYRRYQSVPLYLEWAPLAVLRPSKDAASSLSSTSVSDVPIARDKAVPHLIEGEEDDGASNGNPATVRSLYVKNLSFSTSEETIKSLFQKAGAVRNVRIPKRQGAKSNSAGFCFVEFAEASSVNVALKDFQQVVVDGRELEVSRQEPRLAPVTEPKEPKSQKRALDEEQKTKLVVRNVAFQASAEELRELFKNFGSLKSLRMPKKMDGQHRGFAFVDFQSSHEAADAMRRLKSSHLYGRHLVIDWVENEKGGGELPGIRNSAKRDVTLQASTQNARKRSRGGDAAESDLFDDALSGDED